MKVLLVINPAYEPSIDAERMEYNSRLPSPPNTPPGTPAVGFDNNTAFMQYKVDNMLREWLTKHGILPPPVEINGVPQEVSARQAYEELEAQGLHNDDDPALSEVEKCIALITDAPTKMKIRNLWRKSTTFQRQQPELIALWTGPVPYGLGKTADELDATFISAAKR